MSTFKIILNLCIIFSFISPCVMTNGRKYDVETEAIKLYGEDFRSVLRRFRRTPDYLKILNDKMNDLKVYVKEMSLQVLHYYFGKMTQRVSDVIGITKPYNTDETTTTPTSAMYYHAYNARRQGDDPQPPRLEPESDPNGVQYLDKYPAFDKKLTVAERNSFRDLGFEFAGQFIHSVIHNMGPAVDLPPKSTRLPFGGESDKSVFTTTEHPHTHEVTAESTAGITDNGPTTEEPTAETYGFRYRPHP